jgi:hypothetical protein
MLFCYCRVTSELYSYDKIGLFSSPCQRQCELLPSLGVRRPLTFHILIFSFEIWPGGFRGEDFFRNQPIRNKNGLWWPCLLTDRDEMSNLYRGHSIDAKYLLLKKDNSCSNIDICIQNAVISIQILKNLLHWNCLAKYSETWWEASMEGPLSRLLIPSRSVNKHGHHRRLLFLIGWF